MKDQLTQTLIDEIRENRIEIRAIRVDIAALDKNVLANKMKLSMFIGGISLFFSLGWTILLDKIKTLL